MEGSILAAGFHPLAGKAKAETEVSAFVFLVAQKFKR
jgi:hypothetical protein